jgi:hypothetical protein
MPKKSKAQVRAGPIRPDLLPIPPFESDEAYNAEYPVGEGGGWTSDPLPDEFYAELRDLLYRFGGKDCDNDARLRAIIIDRKRQEPMRFRPIEYAEDNLEGSMKQLDRAMFNLAIATDRVNLAWRIVQHWRANAQAS